MTVARDDRPGVPYLHVVNAVVRYPARAVILAPAEPVPHYGERS